MSKLSCLNSDDQPFAHGMKKNIYISVEFRFLTDVRQNILIHHLIFML